MRYLFDANAISDFMADHPGLRARMSTLSSADDVRTCVTARGEVLFGLERLVDGRRKQALAAAAAEAFAEITCDPTPVAAADHYARLRRDCQRRGRPVDVNDLWIATTALAIGAVVVSRDSDVHGIVGLTVEDWTR